VDVPEGVLKSDLRTPAEGKPLSSKVFRCWHLKQKGHTAEEIAREVLPEQVAKDLDNAVREVWRFINRFPGSPEGQLISVCRRMLDIPEPEEEFFDFWAEIGERPEPEADFEAEDG
jgi:hypothetical protein